MYADIERLNQVQTFKIPTCDVVEYAEVIQPMHINRNHFPLVGTCSSKVFAGEYQLVVPVIHRR